jgi:hypothetical protein
MSKLLLVIAIAFAPLFAIANQPESVHESDCDQMASFAGLVMGVRQDGWAIDAISDPSDRPGSFKAVMISMAWEVRLYNTKNSRDMAISSFSDKWKAKCMRKFGLD